MKFIAIQSAFVWPLPVHHADQVIICMYRVSRPHKPLLEILSRVIKIAWLLVHPTPLFYRLFNCRKFVLTIKLSAVISLMSTSWTHEQIEQQSCRVEAPIHSKFGSNNFSYGTHLTGQIFELITTLLPEGTLPSASSEHEHEQTKNSCDFSTILHYNVSGGCGN